MRNGKTYILITVLLLAAVALVGGAWTLALATRPRR